MPETLLLNRKSLSPILPVLIWTSIALCRLIISSCIRRMFLVGLDIYLRVNRPFVSFCQSDVHLLFAFLCIQVLRVAFSVNSFSGGPPLGLVSRIFSIRWPPWPPARRPRCRGFFCVPLSSEFPWVGCRSGVPESFVLLFEEGMLRICPSVLLMI
jgi:hypothetical protein